ncbi:hypothetical protein EV702DRAFT_1099116 [Suillus placidus]|uniref:Secreted protein n=1 Tax=Suillus placidus TaxID=48579 RepID=A0A9P7D3Q4_9AGAM|nr:hypothetical protein EV702DRAFT_1099116 [Suillus placidus]
MSDASLNRHLEFVFCSLLFRVVVTDACKDQAFASVLCGTLCTGLAPSTYDQCIALYLFLKFFWTYSPMSIQSWTHYRMARYHWLGNPLRRLQRHAGPSTSLQWICSGLTCMG